jgi:hypothetical protein
MRQIITKTLIKFVKLLLERKPKYVWVLAFIDNGQFHIMGVFLTRKEAIANCMKECEFIGPLQRGIRYPEAEIEWTGIEFPLKQTEGR